MQGIIFVTQQCMKPSRSYIAVITILHDPTHGMTAARDFYTRLEGNVLMVRPLSEHEFAT